MDIITSLIDNIIIKFQIIKTNPNQILIPNISDPTTTYHLKKFRPRN